MLDNIDIFNAFTGYEIGVAWLTEDGFVKATNNHILISCPKKLVTNISDIVPNTKYRGISTGSVGTANTVFEPLDTDEVDRVLKGVIPLFSRHIEEGGEVLLRAFEVETPVEYKGQLFNWHYLRLFQEVVEAFGGTWSQAWGKGRVEDGVDYPTFILKNDLGVSLTLMTMRRPSIH